MSDTHRIVTALRAGSVFGALSPEDLQELAAGMVVLAFPAGATVHGAGDPASGLDVLLAGSVFRDDPALATLAQHSGEVSAAGEVFSKGALLLPTIHRNRLRASTDVSVARLDRDVFLAALARARPCAQRLLDGLVTAIAAEIREVNETAHRLLAD